MTSLREVHRRCDAMRQAVRSGKQSIAPILQDPPVWLQSTTVGDALCWVPGLSEADVTQLLDELRMNWGRRLSMLTDVQCVDLLERLGHAEPIAA